MPGSKVKQSLETLPDDLLRFVLAGLPFRAKIKAERVSKRRRKQLAAPEAVTPKVWGSVQLDCTSLGTKLCGFDLETSTCGLSQSEMMWRLLPVCRWLAARAPGMTCLKMDFTEPRWQETEAYDALLTSMLPAILALSANIRLDMSLTLSGLRASWDLLTQPRVAARLAQHLVDLTTQWPEQRKPEDFSSLCSLTRLTSLDLWFEEHNLSASAMPAAIAQLTALKYLSVSIPFDGHHHLTVPPEFSRLKALSYLLLHGFENCENVFCSLPKLTHLDLVHTWDGQSDDQPNPIFLPLELTGLSSLTSLKLNSTVFGNTPWALSCLHSLRELCLDTCKVGAGLYTVEDFGLVLARLTMLSCLSIEGPVMRVDLAALSTLTDLEDLSYTGMGIDVATCSAAWGKLTSLCLSCNRLTRMPSNLSALTALVHLNVGSQAVDFQLHDSLLDLMKAMPALRNISVDFPPLSQHSWDADSLYHLVEATEASRKIPGCRLRF